MNFGASDVTSRRVFSYLTADKADSYAAVMQVFTGAKSRFALHLRPSDVYAALPPEAQPITPESLDLILGQLCEWGNLEAHPDTSDVATVEEFYRARHLYQMTLAGEAVERALTLFQRMLQQPGELKTAALGDVRALLGELHTFAAAEEIDEAKAHRTLSALAARFDDLTSQAQRFIGSLHRAIDLHGIEIHAFLAYKKTLIDYLERFIGELTVAGAEIVELIGQVESAGEGRLLCAAARRDLVDTLNVTNLDRCAAEDVWRARWMGLRRWFIGDATGPSQGEVLRGLARAAIPNLLMAVSGINDRRVSRTDRVSDLRTLARRFAEADSDAQAHRIWRAAFGLTPSRHLGIDEKTLMDRDQEPVPAQTSWLAAPPILIEPRLRAAGHVTRRGRPHSVIDRTREKLHLAQLAEDEARQIAAAKTRLVTGRPIRLSDLGVLGPMEFQLFLDILGQALATKLRPTDVAEATSVDGSLKVVLAPIDDDKEAIIRTTFGEFRGRDHLVTIVSTTMGAATVEGTSW